MPIAKVQLPDGRIARFEVPDGTAPQQVLTYAENYFGKGVTQTPNFGPESMEQSMSAAGKEMGVGHSFLAGIGTRLNDFAMRAKQLLGQSLTPQEQADITAGRAATGAAGAGRFAADVGIGLPLAPQTLLGSATAGAAQGFATNPVLGGESGVRNAANYAIGSGIGHAGMRAIQGAIRPITPSADVQALAREGIIPTIGESARASGSRTGETIGRLEEAATSFPLVGQVIQGSRRRAGVEELGHAALARATPRGIEPTQRIGRDGLDDTYNAISGRYNEALERIGIVRQDQQFINDLNRNVANAVTGLPREAANNVRQIIQDLIGNRETPIAGAYTARIAQQVDEDIGARIRDFDTSSDASSRLMSRALRQAQLTWRDLIRRNAPNAETKEMLDDARRAFANYIRVENAANRAGAVRGEFNSTQLAQAVRQTSGGGARHAQHARGDALMQDLSDPARSVLTSTLGESGTVPRALLSGALLSGGLAGGAYGNEQAGGPGVLTGALAASALAPLLYSRAASRYAIGDLLPLNIQNTLAELARASAPYAGILGRAVAEQQAPK